MLHIIVLVLHVIGAGLMLGTVFFAFIIALKKVLDPSKLSLLKNIFVFGTIGAIWQTITGIILYFQEKDEFEDSKIFLVKIELFNVPTRSMNMLFSRLLSRAITGSCDPNTHRAHFSSITSEQSSHL